MERRYFPKRPGKDEVHMVQDSLYLLAIWAGQICQDTDKASSGIHGARTAPGQSEAEIISFANQYNEEYQFGI